METLYSYYKYYKKVNDTTVIEIRLPDVRQVYNPLDPSPYPQKALDRRIEEFIVDAVRDFPPKTDLKLAFYLPKKEMQNDAVRGLDETIRNHFRYLAARTEREIANTFLVGRIGLVIGISFLALTLLVNLMIARKPDTIFNEIIRNSLLIIGWVAMWQPISNLFYAWQPFRQKLKIYQKIYQMEISILPSEGIQDTGPSAG
jgi:hypothetical protein